jgi:nucleotide-binding universal stress UspA family protein
VTPESLFRRVVVPVASQTDAGATAAALAPCLGAAGDTVVAVHVLPDEPPAGDEVAAEERAEFAEAMFDRLTAGLADADVEVETHLRSGDDVAAAIIDAARERDASAIAFTPRGGSRWVKLLTGDVSTTLVNESDVPVVVLPDADED